MGNGLAGMDPLSACRNQTATHAEESTELPVQQVASFQEDNDDAEHELMQIAMQQSLEEHELARETSDDRALQEALLQSVTSDGGVALSEDEAFQAAMLESCSMANGGSAPTGPTNGSAPPEMVAKLEGLLSELALERMDVGSTNMNEGGDLLSNQCFYLAISRSWLADAARGGGLLIRDSALQLKREIEGRVLEVRGEAAHVGDEVEACTDFLACAMRGEGPASGSAVVDLAVVVFASTSGTLEAYEGQGYSKLPREQQVANLALVWHRPGHFESVVAQDKRKPDLALREVLEFAEQLGVEATVVRA